MSKQQRITGIYKDEDIVFINYTEEKYGELYCKLFDNDDYFAILKQLNKCEILLIQFLALQADTQTNIVPTDRRKLHEFQLLFGEETYSYGTLRTAIKRLKEYNLLIPLEKRGAAIVNPKYFTRESEGVRKRIIAEIRKKVAKELKLLKIKDDE